MRYPYTLVTLTAALLVCGAVNAASPEGWFVGGYLIQMQADEGEGSTQTTGAIGNTMFDQFPLNYDDATGFGATVGYDFRFGRLELAIQQFASRVGEPAASNFGSDEIEAFNLMGNVWVTVYEWNKLRPYLGGGLGMVELELGAASDSVPSGQVGAGVEWQFSDHWIADAGIRLRESGTLKGRNGNTNITAEYNGMLVVLGLNYSFQGAPSTAGEGVPDADDRCAGTASGAKVDSEGCELDSDGDNVPDSGDKCPGTAPGVRVQNDGCEWDSDGDGVPNSRDKCPGSPSGITVDTDGCAQDADGDGVLDFNDRCANTPAGTPVMSNGCGRRDVIVLRGVNFENNSDRLRPDARQILDAVAEVISSSPGFVIEVQGHTSSVGSESYNLALSERRARAVRAFLVSLGVAGDRMLARGYGESRPIASNATQSGRAENRRVAMEVIDQPDRQTDPAAAPAAPPQSQSDADSDLLDSLRGD